MIIHSCLKASIVVPLPKKNPINTLSDYGPLALTSNMKCFEKLVRKQIISSLSPKMDKHHFAYGINRSTEDAIAIIEFKCGAIGFWWNFNC